MGVFIPKLRKQFFISDPFGHDIELKSKIGCQFVISNQKSWHFVCKLLDKQNGPFEF
jgi:hypothetical protein